VGRSGLSDGEGMVIYISASTSKKEVRRSEVSLVVVLLSWHPARRPCVRWEFSPQLQIVTPEDRK
jgi:hypothetical protein